MKPWQKSGTAKRKKEKTKKKYYNNQLSINWYESSVLKTGLLKHTYALIGY